ncbi:alpha/beta fold hydrolase [Noviherbaspirillum saxi]|uniref:Proline iminopeptidase n=1 Tax=Noviherbaspirillum saxi TaxID=2320863 RepID=A0A3A3FZC2_9BURK|nr:alpha/beta fold hydrolase [Noviherbaspirillum saxi]RJF92439.1 alpha/beta fold hydrolase [Noviherbaspirillum saxi]
MQSIPLNATSMPEQFEGPLNEGFLNVGDGHRLYVAQYGQPDAPAVVVLHGGPGSGCHPSMLEWFDLRCWRVILVDQRGAGRSASDDPLSCNTTADLVRDLERLRKALRIDSWTVVGGSWGACLALLYAGHAPEAVSNLILRGAFLATDEDVRWFFQGLRPLVPDEWMHLTADWSNLQQGTVFQTLAALLQNGTVVEQEEAARRWGQYEDGVMRAMCAMFAARTRCPEPQLEKWLPKYRLQAHYLSMRCFTSTTSLANAAARASAIPTTIIHGTHDWICRPQNAAQLKRWMRQARLEWIARGTHIASDPLIRNALRSTIANCVA